MNNGEFDPKFEITFLDKKLKQAFKNVGKDVSLFQGDISDFKKFVTKEFGKLLLAEEKVSELLKLEKNLTILKKKVDLALEKEVKEKFDSLSQKLSEIVDKTVDKKEYQAKIKQIDEIFAEKHVRKIDLAKVENQVNNFRKELESFSSAEKSMKVLKEDFIDFKKQALTRYNFDKLEKWLKEIEKDVLVLVSLKKKVDMLISVKEAENMHKSFDRNTGEFIKMRKHFERLLALDDDFKKYQKTHKEQFSSLSKKFRNFDGDLTSLENYFDKLERRLVRLEKAGKKVKATKTAKVKKKKSKKKSQNIFKRAIDWLLEDTD